MVHRKQIVENTIRGILEEHPEGLYKNDIITQLEKRGITTRATFYQHFKEYCDPKSANLIKIKKYGKRDLCFPTSYTLVTVEFSRKLVVVNGLLDFIEKNPDIGNVLIITKKRKRAKTLARTEIFHKRNIIEFVDAQEFLKKRVLRNKIKIEIVPVGARNSILKELPFYLVNKINSVYKSHSNKLKKELVKELFPVMNYCVDIFSNSISKNPLDAREVFGTLIKKIDRIENVSVGPYTTNASPAYISTREFEDIVWYYFFLVSLHFSNNRGIEDTKEQQIVTNFIREFFPHSRSFIDFEEIKEKMKKFV